MDVRQIHDGRTKPHIFPAGADPDKEFFEIPERRKNEQPAVISASAACHPFLHPGFSDPGKALTGGNMARHLRSLQDIRRASPVI